MSLKPKTPTEILDICKDIQLKKAQDYQNPNSRISQADYYLNGIASIYELMHTKMLRIRSVMESAQANSGIENTEFESLRDSAQDLINYSSFFASWLTGGIQGQNPDNGLFNNPK